MASQSFFNAAILTAKILVNGATRVVGRVKEIGNFADVGSVKYSKAFSEGLEHFKSRGLMCTFVIREEVRNDSVRDRVDDVEFTSKMDVRVVREVDGGPVVIGLGNVDLGYVVGFRGLVYTSWLNLGGVQRFSPSLCPI